MAAIEAWMLESLGFYIRERRRALGLTQSQLAERLGWVQERISLLENGKYGMPAVPALSRLAGALETSLQEILASAGFLDGGRISPERENKDMVVSTALLYAAERLLSIQGADLREVLNSVANLLGEVLGAEKIDAFMYEATTDALVVLGCSDTPLTRRQREAGLDRIPIANRDAMVTVFEDGQVFRTGRADRDPSVAVGVKEELGVMSILAVPLAVASETRGVLVAQSTQPELFSEDDERFLLVIAHWVGIVIHRLETAEAREAEGQTALVG
jgi:transcriptional regulator with XRE-family HTH domain